MSRYPTLRSPPIFATDLVDPFEFEARFEERSFVHAARTPRNASPDIKALLGKELERITKLSDTAQPILKTLLRWKESLENHAEAPKQLIYLLDEIRIQNSNEETINLDALVGNDYLRGQALRKACEQSGFLLFICYLSKDLGEKEEGDEEDYDSDVYDEDDSPTPADPRITYEINNLVDIYGKKVLEVVKASKDNVIQPDFDKSMRFGMQNAPYALLILPETQFVPFLESALDEIETSATHILPYLLNDWRYGGSRQPALDRIRRICTTMTTKREERLRTTMAEEWSDHIYALDVAAICVETGEHDLFARAIDCVQGTLQPHEFSPFRAILKYTAFKHVQYKLVSAFIKRDLC